MSDIWHTLAQKLHNYRKTWNEEPDSIGLNSFEYKAFLAAMEISPKDPVRGGGKGQLLYRGIPVLHIQYKKKRIDRK